MSERTIRGWKWFGWTALIIVSSNIWKMLAAIKRDDTDSFALTVIFSISWVVFFGLPAFFLGWATAPKRIAKELPTNGVGGAADASVVSTAQPLTLAPYESLTAAGTGCAQHLISSPPLIFPRQESPSPETSTSESTTEQDIEGAIYERISDELECKTPLDKGVWTKAFAMTEGDDAKARATYINLRFEKLHKLEQSRLAAELVAQVEEARLAAAQHRQQEMERVEFEKLSSIEKFLAKNSNGVVAKLSGTPNALDFLSAVQRKDVEKVIAMLQENPLYVAISDLSSGNTPLHYAAGEKNTPIAKILVDAGAPYDQRNNFGASALEFLASRKMTEIVEHINVVKELRKQATA